MAGANETPRPTSCFNPYGNDDTPKKDLPTDASVPQGNPKRPPGYVSSLTVDLETLDSILNEQRTKANGTVRLEMALSADLVVHSTASGKQNIENYEVVLTWSGDSDFDQQQPKSVLDDILSETKWKISKIINLSEARNSVKEDGESGNEPMESAEGYISVLKLKLETLHKTLKELRTTLNGAVRMMMPLSAMAVDSTDESGKHDVKNYEVVFTWSDDSDDLDQKQRQCPAVCAQQDVKNYDVVLTMGEDSDSGHKRRKCVLHDFLFGTNWKISKKILPAEAVVPLGSAKGQYKGKEKAWP